MTTTNTTTSMDLENDLADYLNSASFNQQITTPTSSSNIDNLTNNHQENNHIYKLYKDLNWLPETERIQNISWRLNSPHNHSNSKIRSNSIALLNSSHKVTKPKIAKSKSISHNYDNHGLTTNAITDDFDYVAHIKRISQDEVFQSLDFPPNLSSINSKQSSSSAMMKPSTQPAKNVASCSNCQTKSTPLWRRSSTGDILCNACGLFYKLHGVIRPVNKSKQKPKTRRSSKAAAASIQDAKEKSKSPGFNSFYVSPTETTSSTSTNTIIANNDLPTALPMNYQSSSSSTIEFPVDLDLDLEMDLNSIVDFKSMGIESFNEPKIEGANIDILDYNNSNISKHDGLFKADESSYEWLKLGI